MSSILCVTWDGGGNLPPMLAIAAELARRGHTVRVLGHEAQRSAVEEAGLEFEPFERARRWSVIEQRSALADPFAFAAVFTDRGIGADLVASVARRPVDSVLIDGLLIGGMHEADAAHIPYRILVHTLRHVMIGTLNTGPLGLIMRLRGLNPRRLYGAAVNEVVTALPSLDPSSAEAPDTVEFVGPVLPAALDSHRTTGTPLILVSLSTTAIPGQRRVLQRVLDAVGGLPVTAIVTTGPAVDPAELQPAANTTVHRFVPHRELMPRASLVVGHGGHGTTMLALAHGVPLVLLPLNPAFDQPTIARVVSAAGAGVHVRRSSSTATIAAEVARVLASAEHRLAAERLGSQLRAAGGTRVGADIVGGARTRQ